MSVAPPHSPICFNQIVSRHHPPSPGGKITLLSTTALMCAVNIQPISVTACVTGSLKAKICQLSLQEAINANVGWLLTCSTINMLALWPMFWFWNSHRGESLVKDGLALMTVHLDRDIWSYPPRPPMYFPRFTCWLDAAGAWNTWRREGGTCNVISLIIFLKYLHSSSFIERAVYRVKYPSVLQTPIPRVLRMRLVVRQRLHWASMWTTVWLNEHC